MKCILTLIATAALTPMSRAFDLWAQNLPYPGTSMNGNATQVCVGKFTDDVIADGALLCGGHIYLMYAPERFACYADSNTSVLGTNVSFTSMTKVKLSDQLDGLIASYGGGPAGGGLALLQWNATERRLTASVAWSTDASWNSATQLQTVDLSVSSTTKICGVSSNNRKILFADWSSNSIMNSSSYTPGVVIKTFAALNWRNTGGIDFAYDDGTGLNIVSPATTPPTLLYSYANSYAGQPLLLRLPNATTTDYVVWASKNPFGTDEVVTVVRSSGGTNSPPNDGSIELPMSLGTVTAASLTLAAIDNDGAQDLVITHASDRYAHVLYRQTSGSSSFSYTSSHGGQSNLLLDLSAVYGTGSCSTPPAVGAGDLNGDGDDDIIFAGQPTCGNQARICFADGINEEYHDVLYPTTHARSWVRCIDFVADWPSSDLLSSNDLQLTIDPWWMTTTGPSSVATNIRVTVWGQQTATGPIDPIALSDGLYDKSGYPFPVNVPPNYLGPKPPYLVICFNYVYQDPISLAITHSYPSWIGQLDRSLPPGCQGTDAGGEITGGIRRPPPPPSSVPTP